MLTIILAYNLLFLIYGIIDQHKKSIMGKYAMMFKAMLGCEA